MLKRTTIILATILIVLTSQLKADEGMWIPILLKKYNIETMKKKGFRLTAEDIYSVNQASMKDAVMIFGGGCTGELISDQGLLITNHHCGYGAIQKHSSLEHDYLTNGFWAMKRKDELQNKNLTVKFLVRMDDVTDNTLEGVTENMSEAERQKIIKENISKIEKKAIEGTDYIAIVKPFFYGNQYYLFVQEVFKDIRLVGAPPSAIGKFGGDTDNWMWPRHTGDFSLFRIYADKNNKPAEYSEDNVPYKPKKHFPISIKGVKKGDFTMVFGFPGSTEEYLTSYAVEMITKTQNPHRINIRQNKIDIISADMETDLAVRIQYASKYAGISNTWKKWIGENRGLKRLNAIEKKRAIEKRFTDWANADKIRNEKYRKLLPAYREIYSKLTNYQLAEDYFFEAIWRLEPVQIAVEIADLNNSPNKETVENIRKYAKGFFKDYNKTTDKKVFRKMIEMYINGVEEQFQPGFFEFTGIMKYLGISKEKALNLYTDAVYENSILVNEDKLYEFLNNFEEKDLEILEKDPIYRFYREFIKIYVWQIRPVTQESDTKLDLLNRTYMKALQEMDSEKVFYPDANFTLRVAYGQVDDYEPKDGVFYKHYTTLEGIMQKDNPDIYDYKVPAKLKELYEKKDYGIYAENGELHICFTASNHTTGGNSGSPVINGDGELIGINFDRNWEGTMSDIMYDPDQCRNISLDIRYALFLIDKFAGAKHLIDEMTIISE